MKANPNKQNYLTLFICLITGSVVFLFYLHTINYSWKFFDEDIIFNETVMPAPASFSEIFEMIKLFGLNNHFIASNPLYSNISNIRCDKINNLILLFVFFLFQKNVSLYHLTSILLHTINTCLLFLILNSVAKNYSLTSLISNLTRLSLISLLTLLWSLHPAIVEPVLFACNWPTLLSYTLAFTTVFCFFNSKTEDHFSFFILTFILFISSLFICEHSVTLPLILFFYIYANHQNNHSDYFTFQTILYSLKKLLPLLLVLAIFIFHFFSSLTKENLNMIAKTPLEVTLERIFWLAPQIFLHFLKLIFFPITLSIDQTAQVKFSHYLFHPYAILCFLIMFGLLFLSLISFFYVRRRGFFYLFILFIPFFFSLFPFLHILSPIYNLASERYLYSPLFFLIIGFSYILFSLISDFSQKKFIPHLSVIILLLILCTLSTRTYFRTLDWSDSYTLLTSAIKTSPNNLYKGLRLEMVASSLKTFQKDISQNTINKYNEASRRTLKKALIYFKNKKIKYQDKTPQVIKFYGLDPKTLEAKVAFLLAFTEYSNNSDPYKAYKIFEPYAKNLGFLDTIILDFYYQILFNTKNIDAAENILHKALNQRRFSPVLFVALSDLCEFKYNDLTLTEKYLNQSFKYFPYDPSTLFGLKRLYKKLNNAKEFAFYSYLYGLRTHDPESLKEAAHVYLALNNKEMSKNILQKLLREYINDPQVIQTKIIYEQIFGRL